MKIALASDHAAVEMKTALIQWLNEMGHEITDCGPHNDDSVDYPDYGYKLAAVIADKQADFGIAICGSGIGISIAVNRHHNCRCALVGEPLSAKLSREHNDANVIALGARLTGIEMAKECVATFINTSFGGERHQRRVTKLSNPQF
ncbi:ribose 5-phosphate isomerase B [Sphingorhabdus lutea]|uniref:Ribose 5-phosphate isomerase B n=1 Tax=Sphingorhabdus lutea TaxID=1913578 RepID=A0A1L3JCJ7_9SPHN|nr:ribose 5-phosphate isomerase B [Sphingorhabdus lutea]APG62865.1 ribose 5-phosphate isomerase B [Sphingorhabdus lutea]